MFKFLKKILLSTMIIILLGFFPVLLWGQEVWFEILVSFFISLLNAIVGYYLVLNSIHKSEVEFYKNIYGGMLIRMALVFGSSIYLIKFNFVLMTPYMLFLLFFYIFHQWIEISSWLNEFPNT